MREMPPRARQLIDTLHLLPHPEGGFYREIFRSALAVAPRDGRTERAALTSIYFLLAAGMTSAWHRVVSDEVWHWYEGDPLELFVTSGAIDTVKRQVLGPVAGPQVPVFTVPGGAWQAARPLGAYTLVGCTVAPGFEFQDFSFLRDDAVLQERLAAVAPDQVALL